MSAAFKIERAGPETSLPAVSIVGRPNVGKSTLFNRLVGSRKAIVHKESHTTRDYIGEVVRWRDRPFYLIDTGGIEFASPATLQKTVEDQVDRAIEHSQLLLWVVDGQKGLTPLDERLAGKLRRTDKRVLLIVNKLDDRAAESDCADFFRLGLKEVFPVSALHGHGTGDLLDKVTGLLPAANDKEPEAPQFTLTIVGEPNSGKSTFLNRLLGLERSMVSEVPGTTRDRVEELIRYDGHLIKLVDTAGMRSSRKTEEAVSFYSLTRAKEAVRMADVVLLLFDATRGFVKSSKAIASFVHEEGKACILVANKWDLVKETSKRDYAERLVKIDQYLQDFDLQFISALTGDNALAPLKSAVSVQKAFTKEIPTRQLNSFLEIVHKKNPPPPTIKLRFLVQNGTRPPSFALFVKHLRLVPEDYRLFLRKQLIRYFDLRGVPIRLRFREVEGKSRRY